MSLTIPVTVTEGEMEQITKKKLMEEQNPKKQVERKVP